MHGDWVETKMGFSFSRGKNPPEVEDIGANLPPD